MAAERSLRFDLIARDRSFSKTLDQMGRKGERLNRQFTRTFGDTGDRAGREFGVRLNKRLGGGMSASAKVARVGAGAIGGALAAAGLASFAKDSVMMAATFDKTMRQVAAVTKVPQQQMGELRKVALDMGAKTSFSARQAGDAMLALGKGGLTFAQMKAGALSSTLTLAAAGSLELGEAAEYVVQGLKTFGLRADQSAKVAAALAGAANASVSSVQDMGLSLSQAGAQARNAGLSIEETTGVLAAFADNGIRGSDAGTSLKVMLQRLVPTTAKAKDTMADLGLEFEDAHGNILPVTEIAQRLQDRLKGLSEAQRISALNTIFGSDALRAATILMREGEAGLAKYIKATSDRAAAEKLAKTNTEGAAGAFERLSGAIETIQIQIGDAFLPKLADAAEWLARTLPAALEKVQRALATVGRWWDDNRHSVLLLANALRGNFNPAAEESANSLDRVASASVTLRGALDGTLTLIARTTQAWNWLVIATYETAAAFADLIIGAGYAANAIDKISGGSGHAADEVVRFGRAVKANAIDTISQARTNIDLAQGSIDALATSTGTATGAANSHATALQREKQAVDALKGALDNEKNSELDLRQAKLNVQTAQDRLNTLKRAGRKGSIEYKQAQIDLERAQVNLRRITDEYKAAQQRSAAATRGAMQASQQAIPPYRKFGETARTAGIRARTMGQMAREGLGLIHSKKVTVTAKFGINTGNTGLSVHQIVGATGGYVTPRAIVPRNLHRGGFLDGPGTETSDSIPARLSKGEYVVRAKAVRAVGRDTLDHINAQGFATGGPVLEHDFASGREMGRAGRRFNQVLDESVQKMAARFKKNMDKLWGGALGGGSGPGGWRWQMAVLRRVFPGLPLISGFRPGAITATGNRSYHASGRAVDVPPRMDVFNFIRGAYGQRTRELIFSPAGGRQVWNGRPHMYTGITRANHWDHVHWAYDQGGWLMPGTTVAHNNTGRPERVLPPGEPVIDYDKLARAVARATVQALASQPPRAYLDPNQARAGIRDAQRRGGIPAREQLR